MSLLRGSRTKSARASPQHLAHIVSGFNSLTKSVHSLRSKTVFAPIASFGSNTFEVNYNITLFTNVVDLRFLLLDLICSHNNILIGPLFIKTLLECINRVSLHTVIW